MANVLPPRSASTAVTYAAHDSADHATTINTTTDTSATITFTTTSANTKWLIEVTATLNGATSSSNATIAVKVDGTSTATDGRVVQSQFTNAGYVAYTSARGRLVLTLAAASSHTLIAQVIGGSVGSVSFGAVTISATAIS